MTDPNDVEAPPDLDDRTEQTTEITPGEAETDEAASAGSQDDTDDIVLHTPVWRRLILAATLSALTFMLVGGSVWTLGAPLVDGDLREW